MKISTLTACALSPLLPSFAFAQITLDGQNIPSEGLTLRATQTSATAFGDSSGTQASTGGSELNQLYADFTGTTLEMGVTGNLEANFNKFFIFFDGVSGGENVLQGDNADGGFGEINELAGLGFADGFTADHGLRLEIGSTFWGLNSFDLIDNTATTIASGTGGPGDLPLNDEGGVNGVTFGWDNGNALGVDGSSAASADTATTGFEFSIDITQLLDLPGAPTQNLGVSMFITNDAGDFISNQFLPGLDPASSSNAGASPFPADVGSVTLTVPEPSAYALVAGALVMALAGGRRR